MQEQRGALIEKEMGKIIPILALLENGKVIAAQRPSQTACLPKFLLRSAVTCVWQKQHLCII